MSRGLLSTYPSFFEAGYLSGRSLHASQGRAELFKVIGHVKSLVSAAKSPKTAAVGNRVFIVHGHNDASLQLCARFLEKLDVPFTILREQPNHGRTIIEKFVDYSDAAFAIVLFTGDDRGGPIDATYGEQRLRARQNVVLELGFFLGRLGRDRVCVLYEPGVEIPSDYSGVLFVEIDARQGWRLELTREMKAAGLQVDLNKAV